MMTMNAFVEIPTMNFHERIIIFLHLLPTTQPLLCFIFPKFEILFNVAYICLLELKKTASHIRCINRSMWKIVDADRQKKWCCVRINLRQTCVPIYFVVACYATLLHDDVWCCKAFNILPPIQTIQKNIYKSINAETRKRLKRYD